MEETLVFQKGCKEDIQEIFEAFSEGIKEMIANGIYQWDEVYPGIEDLENDLECEELYVGKSEGNIGVVYVLNKDYDDQYQNGKWVLETEEFMVIHRLCVHPKFQNHGFGKKTLLHIEETLKSQGIQSIRLDAYTLNPYALRMYNSLGYSVVGEADFRKGKFYLMEKILRDNGENQELT
jgi:ribosomal protein S18 acetylase RimI-like enzyme